MEIDEVVALKIDLPDEGLMRGMRGTVVHVFEAPTRAYEVEFCNDRAETIAQVALKPDQIERL